MTRPAQMSAPDQVQRDAAIAERVRNVLIDAGAGTGKTAILVNRLVQFVAPSGDIPSIPILRVAAITFTRKAGGELRLRIRERLLEELVDTQPNSKRDLELREALAGLDTAYIGTIHSFADRLLRLRPVEAQLSPSYEIAEDETPLIEETFDIFIQSIESGTLASELAGKEIAARAEEATQTVLEAIAAGVKVESQETEWNVIYGLDSLVEGFIRHRDVPPMDAAPAPLDMTGFRAAVDEFLILAAPLCGGSIGADWILQTADVLRQLRTSENAITVPRRQETVGSGPSGRN